MKLCGLSLRDTNKFSKLQKDFYSKHKAEILH